MRPAVNGYLMDTNIVSAFAPGKPPLPGETAAWMRLNADVMFIPSLAFQEIRRGIAKLDRAGGHERAARLLAWLDGLLEAYGERILAVDCAVAMTAGIMEDAERGAGRDPCLADILIASTAKTHGLRLLTANMRHFEPLGIDCLDPYDERPDSR